MLLTRSDSQQHLNWLRHIHNNAANFLLPLVVCAGNSVFLTDAQAVEPMVTDRPTDSASPVVVPKGSFQVEAGYKASDIDSEKGDGTSHLFPDLLMRYGFSDRFEGRLYASGWTIEDRSTGSEDGFSDINIGTKIFLAEEKNHYPAMAILIDISMPLGSTEQTSDYVIPKVLFVGSNTLSEHFSLTYNVGPSYVTYKEAGQRKSDWDMNYAIALGGPVTETISWFSEIYGIYIYEREIPDLHNLQAGSTILLSPNIQLDFRGGIGLVSHAPDWFAGAGIAFRFLR